MTKTQLDETDRVRAIFDELAPRYDRVMDWGDRILFGGGREWLAAQASGEVLGGSLSEDVIRELTDLLTLNGVLPVSESQDSRTVLVQITIDATSDRAAQAAAESMLRDRDTRRVAGTRPASVHDHLRRGEAEP